MKKYFISMLSDNSGGISYTRVNCLMWSVTVLIIWLVACVIGLMLNYKITTAEINNYKKSTSVEIKEKITIFEKNPFPNLPEWIIAVLLSFHGFKTVQRFGEKNEIQVNMDTVNSLTTTETKPVTEPQKIS